MAEDDFFTKGVELLREGKFKAASDAFHYAIANDQEPGWAYLNLSKAQLGIADEAQKRGALYNKMVDRALFNAQEADKMLGKGRNISALLQIAKVYALKGFFTEAQSYVDQILAHPQMHSSEVYSQLAVIYDRLGSFGDAYSYCKVALQLDPKNKEAASLLYGLRDFFIKGGKLLGAKKYREAMAAFNEAIKNNQHPGWAQLFLSRAWLGLAAEARESGKDDMKMLGMAAKFARNYVEFL